LLQVGHGIRNILAAAGHSVSRTGRASDHLKSPPHGCPSALANNVTSELAILPTNRRAFVLRLIASRRG
jgi:hypothetical protein